MFAAVGPFRKDALAIGAVVNPFLVFGCFKIFSTIDSLIRRAHKYEQNDLIPTVFKAYNANGVHEKCSA